MRRTLWVALFGIAMAAVESAVVVYLRALHSGAAPLSVLQYELPTHLLAIEVARRPMTISTEPKAIWTLLQAGRNKG